jgi:hypothetical protein
MKNNLNTIEISNLKGSDYLPMLTPEQMANYLMELQKKGENIDELANKKFKSFKHFIMGSFHFGSSVKGFMYWNGVSITFDK